MGSPGSKHNITYIDFEKKVGEYEVLSVNDYGYVNDLQFLSLLKKSLAGAQYGVSRPISYWLPAPPY